MWQDPSLPALPSQGTGKQQTPSALSCGGLRGICILGFGMAKQAQHPWPTYTLGDPGLGLTLCKGPDLRRVCEVAATPPLSWSTGFHVGLQSGRRSRVALM